MENKKVLNLIIYILPIILGFIIIYLAYTLFINNDFSNNSNESYVATFYHNGADNVSEQLLICNKNKKNCEITLPNITKKDGIVLGWNDENSHVAKYKEGDIVSIDKDTKFYAITYEEYTLIIDNNNLDYLSENTVSCKAYNNEKNCSVIIPNYNKIGYETRGYSVRKNSLTGVIFPNTKYILSKDVILYPVFNTLSRKKVINIEKSINRYGITIEIEKGCNEKIYNEYLNYLEKINNNAKYLLIGSKITFLKDNTFNNIWGNKYLGMNYGPSYLRLFDVKCPNVLNQDYYATMVHELAHTWDFYYSNYYSKSISDENDIINLYTKYQNLENRPFREYSYSNIKEFFADSIRYYYFKYLDPKSKYVNLEYPNDIKEVIDKYICITNNNYNNSNCV